MKPAALYIDFFLSVELFFPLSSKYKVKYFSYILDSISDPHSIINFFSILLHISWEKYITYLVKVLIILKISTLQFTNILRKKSDTICKAMNKLKMI